MHFLFIVDDFLPHSIKVAALMIHQLALEFQRKGHNVTVLTPGTSQNNNSKLQKLDGIDILYFRSGEIKNTGKIKRAINESLFSVRAQRILKKHIDTIRYDGIVYYSPSIFFGPLVGWLKKQMNIPSYLILRDIFPQWTVDNGLMSKHSPIYWYFRIFEQINYQNADTIGVMSPSNLDYFKGRYGSISKFEVLYNWASITELQISSGKFRDQYGLKNKIVFFYGGNIGHAQKMKNLTDLAINLKEDPKVHFLFVGKGDEVDIILQAKKNHNLQNITYLPSVDQNTYFEMLNEYDIGLFSLHPDHKTHNFPGKLLGYMNFAKPILGCVNPGNDLKVIVNSAQAGIVCNSGDNQALLDAAVKLINNSEMRIQMGLNGRKLLQNQFSIENACNQILTALSR